MKLLKRLAAYLLLINAIRNVNANNYQADEICTNPISPECKTDCDEVNSKLNACDQECKAPISNADALLSFTKELSKNAESDLEKKLAMKLEDFKILQEKCQKLPLEKEKLDQMQKEICLTTSGVTICGPNPIQKNAENDYNNHKNECKQYDDLQNDEEYKSLQADYKHWSDMEYKYQEAKNEAEKNLDRCIEQCTPNLYSLQTKCKKLDNFSNSTNKKFSSGEIAGMAVGGFFGLVAFGYLVKRVSNCVKKCKEKEGQPALPTYTKSEVANISPQTELAIINNKDFREDDISSSKNAAKYITREDIEHPKAEIDEKPEGNKDLKETISNPRPGEKAMKIFKENVRQKNLNQINL